MPSSSFATFAAFASFAGAVSCVTLGTVAVLVVMAMRALMTRVMPLSEDAHRLGLGLGSPWREDIPGRGCFDGRFGGRILLHGRGRFRRRTRVEIDREERRVK